MTRRVLRHALQVALLGFVTWYVWTDWDTYKHVLQQATPQWQPVLASGVLVGVAYLVLIQTWRQVVVAWGEHLSFASAARIWFVSNLGKYVPGKVWAIAAMGTLAREQGVSPVAAIGSALVIQLVNLVTGFAVVLIAGANAADVPAAAIGGAGALAAALLAAPALLPHAVALVNQLGGRQLAVPHLPRRAIWWAASGTTVAWVLYGFAFALFVRGMSAGAVTGSLGEWTAIFVGSYLVGFIAVFAPGGAGAREVAMAEALQRTGLALGAVSLLLVAASRIWLTVLEVIPGVLLLRWTPLKRTDPSSNS